jgi:hypothetical protein
MNLPQFGLYYVAIIEFVKKAFKLNGWLLRGVALVLALAWSIVGNSQWFHYAEWWKVLGITVGLWSIPGGFYDGLKNTAIPWIADMLAQIGTALKK